MVARTIARTYSGKKQLGVSFFSRSGGDVGHAGKLVTTNHGRQSAGLPALKLTKAIHHPGSFVTSGLNLHYVLEGTLNGTAVSGLPDSGSEKNIISMSFARAQNLSIREHTKSSIFRLGSGCLTPSCGTVRLSWRLPHELKTTRHIFYVLEKCSHDVILGEPFLDVTKTLTHFMQRIKARFLQSKPTPGVRLLGSQKKRVRGHINGICVSAVADTGSDALLMSKSYAKKRGFKVDTKPESRTLLEFADGSRKRTLGIVEGAQWSFDDLNTSLDISRPPLEFPHASADDQEDLQLPDRSDETPDWTVDSTGAIYTCNFHVLEGLPNDIVLNNSLIYHSQAFSKHAESFYNVVDPDPDPRGGSPIHDLKAIRKFRRKKKRLCQDDGLATLKQWQQAELHRRDLAEETLPNRDDPSWKEENDPLWQAENKWRGEFDLEYRIRGNTLETINKLDMAQRPAAFATEIMRREVWVRKRRAP